MARIDFFKASEPAMRAWWAAGGVLPKDPLRAGRLRPGPHVRTRPRARAPAHTEEHKKRKQTSVRTQRMSFCAQCHAVMRWGVLERCVSSQCMCLQRFACDDEILPKLKRVLPCY